MFVSVPVHSLSFFPAQGEVSNSLKLQSGRHSKDNKHKIGKPLLTPLRNATSNDISFHFS